MSDVVVTVPRKFAYGGVWGIEAWVKEGDPAGSVETGAEYFYSVPRKPRINPGDRVYIIFNNRLRGYSPLVRLQQRKWEDWKWDLVRAGNAVAVTIPEKIRGFQGFRYRWWHRKIEVPFPNWRTA